MYASIQDCYEGFGIAVCSTISYLTYITHQKGGEIRFNDLSARPFYNDRGEDNGLEIIGLKSKNGNLYAILGVGGGEEYDSEITFETDILNLFNIVNYLKLTKELD